MEDPIYMKSYSNECGKFSFWMLDNLKHFKELANPRFNIKDSEVKFQEYSETFSHHSQKILRIPEFWRLIWSQTYGVGIQFIEM